MTEVPFLPLVNFSRIGLRLTYSNLQPQYHVIKKNLLSASFAMLNPALSFIRKPSNFLLFLQTNIWRARQGTYLFCGRWSIKSFLCRTRDQDNKHRQIGWRSAAVEPHHAGFWHAGEPSTSDVNGLQIFQRAWCHDYDLIQVLFDEAVSVTMLFLLLPSMSWDP